MNTLEILGRKDKLFIKDLSIHEKTLKEIISSSSFLILGGAGSIGQSVTKEIFKRNPKELHVVDICENNLVELVRDIRSSLGYIKGDFKTLVLDIGSWQFERFIENQSTYDYVLNLSALKHVRSEKDPFTLLRMIEVNIINTIKSIEYSKKLEVKKYFCVSTDKAANPVNMMGGSKRIMEMFLMKESEEISISTARFANVAFSDGSLLHGFTQRIMKRQPIAAPNDVTRYFVTFQESGELCLMSTIFGENRDIFFPKLVQNLHLIKFSDIAERYLKSIGYKAVVCSNEQEARERIIYIDKDKRWPCYFSESNTTGEKDHEEFFTKDEKLDMNKFQDIGIIKNGLVNSDKLEFFLNQIDLIKMNKVPIKDEIVELFHQMIPNFDHVEKNSFLDSKM